MGHDDSSLPQSVSAMAQLGQLLEQNRPRLLAMLRRRIDPALATRVDADDILSEAFLIARRRWQTFLDQSNGKPFPWLYRIVLDCLIAAWRRETRECRDPRLQMPWPEQSSLQLGFDLVHSGTSPSAAAAREELTRLMKGVLNLLPEIDREILRMRHEDSLSHCESGEILGISENAAAVRYVRALKRLRKIWLDLNSADESQS